MPIRPVSVLCCAVAALAVSTIAIAQQQPQIGIAPVTLADTPYVFDTAEQHKIRVPRQRKSQSAHAGRRTFDRVALQLEIIGESASQFFVVFNYEDSHRSCSIPRVAVRNAELDCRTQGEIVIHQARKSKGDQESDRRRSRRGVERKGLEPLTPALQRRCSPS